MSEFKFKNGEMVNIQTHNGVYMEFYPVENGPYWITRVDNNGAEVKGIDGLSHWVYNIEMSYPNLQEQEETPSNDMLKLLEIYNSYNVKSQDDLNLDDEGVLCSIETVFQLLGWEIEASSYRLKKTVKKGN